MRILITGGRDFDDRAMLFMALDRLRPAAALQVGHGDRDGDAKDKKRGLKWRWEMMP